MGGGGEKNWLKGFFSVIFFYHRWVKKCKQFQDASQMLTCGNQRRCLTVNVQLRRLGPILQDFIKQGTKFVN